MRSIMVSGVHAPVHFRGTESNNVQKNSTYKKHSDKRSEIALIAGLCCMAAGGAALVAIRARNKNAAKSLMLSFDDFIAALKKADIKEPKTLVNDCVDENIIGSGQNSIVYKFSNPLLDNWAMKVIKKDSDLQESFKQPISKMSDDFENVNIEIQDLLENWMDEELEQQMKNFEKYAFFGLSALGGIPQGIKLAGNKINPRRVLDPLLWILAQHRYIATAKK